MKKSTLKYFKTIKKLILQTSDSTCSKLNFEKEGTEYGASFFLLDDKKILFRVSKITPKKIGQFVTVWKRNNQNIIEPLSKQDNIAYLIICTPKNNRLGFFLFPQSILLEKGIFSSNRKKGKLGFRLYPSWDTTTNQQAIKTQQWQLQYFIDVSTTIDHKKIKQLIY